MYGGAAGGGKSVSILAAALQYVDLPDYHALILRRTMQQLKKPGALLDLSHQWLRNTDAKWDGSSRWNFPSGSSLSFGHMVHESSKYNYQGPAWHFIGYDELTQFTETQYKYGTSRTRRTVDSPYPIRIRSGSNPGGIGHDWVKNRFVTGRHKDRVFLPAKLSDNPSLDQAEYIATLEILDPLTRAQLLNGDWDAMAGGRVKAEWLRYYRRVGTHFYFGEQFYEAEKVRGRFLTVDPAASVAQTATDDPDWTVISAWGLTPCGLLAWLGCMRLRVEIPDIARHVWESYSRFGAGKVYIESGGMQKGVYQLARRYCSPDGKRMNVVPLLPGKEDKLVRATAAINMAHAERIWLPMDDPSFPLDDVRSELLRFTGDDAQDSHDDIVDTFAMAGRVIEGKITPKGSSAPSHAKY